MEMLGIPKINFHDTTVKIRLSIDESEIGDIGLLLADQGADAAEHTCVIGEREVEPDGIDRRVSARMPVHVHPSSRLVLELGEGRTVDCLQDQDLSTVLNFDDLFVR